MLTYEQIKDLMDTNVVRTHTLEDQEEISILYF